jgi:hypothetical protein
MSLRPHPNFVVPTDTAHAARSDSGHKLACARSAGCFRWSVWSRRKVSSYPA